MATHSSILAREFPRTEEPGGQQFKGLQSQTQQLDNNRNSPAEEVDEPEELVGGFPGQCHLLEKPSQPTEGTGQLRAARIQLWNPDWFHPSLDSSVLFKNACCGTLGAIKKDFSISYRNLLVYHGQQACSHQLPSQQGRKLCDLHNFLPFLPVKILHRFLRAGWNHSEVKTNPDYSYH